MLEVYDWHLSKKHWDNLGPDNIAGSAIFYVKYEIIEVHDRHSAFSVYTYGLISVKFFMSQFTSV